MIEIGEANNELTVESDNMTCNSLTWLIKSWEGEESVCNKFRVDLVDGLAATVMPILFPFVIEYVLIGASMALIMYNHIGM